MLIYTTGTPNATADSEGDRITASLPSGKHAVEVSLSMFEAMTLATMLMRSVEERQQQVRFRDPEPVILAFTREPQQARSCA